jgi:Asp/Glu/hydantoin racemase
MRENIKEMIDTLSLHRNLESTDVHLVISVDSEMQHDRVEMICHGVGMSTLLAERVYTD